MSYFLGNNIYESKKKGREHWGNCPKSSSNFKCVLASIRLKHHQLSTCRSCSDYIKWMNRFDKQVPFFWGAFLIVQSEKCFQSLPRLRCLQDHVGLEDALQNLVSPWLGAENQTKRVVQGPPTRKRQVDASLCHELPISYVHRSLTSSGLLILPGR